MGRWDHGKVRCQRTFPRWTFQADVGPPPPPDVGTLAANVGGGGDVNVVGGRSILELATKPACLVRGVSMPAGRTQHCASHRPQFALRATVLRATEEHRARRAR